MRSVLSDYVQEGGFERDWRVLAVTPNDEVNALTMREFSSIFGRQNIYRISPWDYKKGRRSSEGPCRRTLDLSSSNNA